MPMAILLVLSIEVVETGGGLESPGGFASWPRSRPL